MAEIINIPIREVEDIQKGTANCLKAIESQGNPKSSEVETILWNHAFTPCESLLRRLHRPLGIERPSIDQSLVVTRTIALLLDLGLVSYTGSHGCRFDKDYLSRNAGAFNVAWETNLFNFQCSLARLACLHDFLDKQEAWVFEVGNSDPTWEAPDS